MRWLPFFGPSDEVASASSRSSLAGVAYTELGRSRISNLRELERLVYFHIAVVKAFQPMRSEVRGCDTVG